MQRALESQRQPLIERVRRDIASQDLFKFVIRVQRLIDAVQHDFDPLAEATVAMAKSMNRWEESFTATREQPDAAGLHTLRIAGKKLRYRAELLSELDPSKVKPLVTSLREIQTTLGDWHDRSVLLRHVAQFIGRPGFLADHPDIGRILLAEMEKERLRYDSDVATAYATGPQLQRGLGNLASQAVQQTERQSLGRLEMPFRAMTRSTRARKSSNTSSTELRSVDDLETIELDHFVKLGEEPALIANETFVKILTHAQVHAGLPVIETAAVQDSRYQSRPR